MSVGLDIGSKTIKIVELSNQGAAWRLQASGVVGYKGNPPNAIEDEKEYVALADVVRKLVSQAKINSKEVNISLPESLVFTKNIKFPSLTDQEIASAVKWEAEQYIPIPVAEAVLEHQIIERAGSGEASEVSVLLIATPRTLVEKYVKVAQMAGLTAVGVETELLALVRALAPPDKTALLLDLGSRSTNIAIAKNGNLCFSRSVPTAGEAFTRALSQGLGVDYAQAEEYKKTYGLSDQLEGKVKSAVEPTFKLVVDEIKKAIQFYQTEANGGAPQMVVVSGGTANMPEAISGMTELLGLEVVVGNPFAKLVVDPDTLNILKNYTSLYSIAVGLALRGE